MRIFSHFLFVFFQQLQQDQLLQVPEQEHHTLAPEPHQWAVVWQLWHPAALRPSVGGSLALNLRLHPSPRARQSRRPLLRPFHPPPQLLQPVQPPLKPGKNTLVCREKFHLRVDLEKGRWRKKSLFLRDCLRNLASLRMPHSFENTWRRTQLSLCEINPWTATSCY